MNKLSQKAFQNARDAIFEYGRPLEQALFDYFFEKGDYVKVLQELTNYQNKDGGFGNGLEPDFLLPDSSPLATTVAFQHLIKLKKTDILLNTIQKGIEYFESTYVEKRKGWFSVSADVNNYPHAPWWNFDLEKRMTIIDHHWGNPSSEIIGYLYKYKLFLKKLNVDELIQIAFKKLIDLKSYDSPHEIYCYIRLYRLLPKGLSEKIKKTLTTAAQSVICYDQTKWNEYVPKPLDFIENPSSYSFGIQPKWVDNHLRFIIGELEEKGFIEPTWEWPSHLKVWEAQRKKWIAILTLDALRKLEQFERM